MKTDHSLYVIDVVMTAEVGNYCDEYVNALYISSMQLLPHQTPEIEYKIMEHHREH